MTAIAVECAQAIVSALNAGTLSFSPCAERVYYPRKKLESFDDGKVFVATTQEETTYVNRKQRRHEFQVQISYQQKLKSIVHNDGEATNAELDELMSRAQEIRELLAWETGLTGTSNTIFKHTGEIRTLFEPDHLISFHQFSTAITATFFCEVDR